jgi:hypothetical protein
LKNFRKLLIGAVSVSVLLGLGTRAFALTLSTDAYYSYETAWGAYSESDPQTASGGTISSTVTSSEGSTPVTADASATEGGDLSAGADLAYLMGGNEPGGYVNATAVWSETVTNSSAGDVSYDFGYDISGVVLSMNCMGGCPNLSSGVLYYYGITIMLDSTAIWQSNAALQADGTLWTSGTELGYTFSSPWPTDYQHDYSFSDYTSTVSLGTYGAGDSFTLTYEVVAGVSGFEDWGQFGEATVAMTGDVTSTDVTPPSQVPEPSTILLLGSGLAGLAFLKKRMGR